jgi:hypothetical protein
VADVAAATARRPADTKLRHYGPEQQVVARIEVSGPQRLLPAVHAGVDVMGDGTTAPYLGRVRRRALHQGEDEDAVTALRRALTAQPDAA